MNNGSQIKLRQFFKVVDCDEAGTVCEISPHMTAMPSQERLHSIENGSKVLLAEMLQIEVENVIRISQEEYEQLSAEGEADE